MSSEIIAGYTTQSAEETMALGRELAATLPSGIVLLRGDLGAGKTTLVKGIAEALGAATPEEVTSPTFTLVHEYMGGSRPLYHLDLYRLDHERELLPLGIDEMESADTLLLIEWGEKFPRLVARAWGEVHIAHGAELHSGNTAEAATENTRRITVTKFLP